MQTFDICFGYWDMYLKDNQIPKQDVPELKWIASIARLMDSKFTIPGTSFRFGLDPLLNLIPFAGNLTGFFISGGLLLVMVKKGASNKLMVMMSLNILLDAVLGAIPFVGQIVDFFFKANNRNVQLMREHYLENKHQGSGKGVIIRALLILTAILAVIIYILWVVADYIVSYFGY